MNSDAFGPNLSVGYHYLPICGNVVSCESLALRSGLHSLDSRTAGYKVDILWLICCPVLLVPGFSEVSFLELTRFGGYLIT